MFLREERKEQPAYPKVRSRLFTIQYPMFVLSCEGKGKEKSQTTATHSVSISQPGRQTGARTMSWGSRG